MQFSEKQRHLMYREKLEVNMEEFISDAVEEEPHRNTRKACRKRVYLFNCDNLICLDSVEKLLLDMKGDIRRELSFDIVKTYFPLSQMWDMCEKTIPNLHMDVAIFVVHANESCLSINGDDAGIGYAKVYKALLRATGMDDVSFKVFKNISYI